MEKDDVRVGLERFSRLGVSASDAAAGLLGTRHHGRLTTDGSDGPHALQWNAVVADLRTRFDGEVCAWLVPLVFVRLLEERLISSTLPPPNPLLDAIIRK